MQRITMGLATRSAIGALALCVALGAVVLDARTCLADGPEVFVFFKLLETAESGGNEPFTDGNAYWYGKGRFRGSPRVYDLKVTLPADRKFPGYGPHGKFIGMGYINPTRMTYELSRKGRVVRTIVFRGWASLVERNFFLHDGTVTPEAGWSGAFDCPPENAPPGFSFTHTYDRDNILMRGYILSKWTGTQVDPCGNVVPSMGPKLVVGRLVFPDDDDD
jgi:hypothetical protein